MKNLLSSLEHDEEQGGYSFSKNLNRKELKKKKKTDIQQIIKTINKEENGRNSKNI